jgi:hypothetical protein
MKTAALFAALAAVLGGGCVAAPRMCVVSPDCGGEAACVAGRCLRRDAVAAVTLAQRWVYTPVDVALVARGSDSLAETATLGRGDGALALLRFAVTLPADAVILEGYLLLREDTDVDRDPDPITLHAVRIAEPWRGDSVSWVWQPRTVEVGAPATLVPLVPGRTLRLDVRAIVQRWRTLRGDDFGIGVVAEGRSATGVTLALAPIAAAAGRADRVPPDSDPRAIADRAGPARTVIAGPELELYVRAK